MQRLAQAADALEEAERVAARSSRRRGAAAVTRSARRDRARHRTKSRTRSQRSTRSSTRARLRRSARDASTPRSLRAQGRCAGRSPRIVCAPRRPLATCSNGIEWTGGGRSVHLGADRAECARPARGTRPRLGRAAPARARPQLDLDVDGRQCAARPARRGPAVPQRAPCARPTAMLGFVYKAAAEIGELGRQHAARCATRSRPTSCCTSPSPPTPRRSPSSATRGGRASGIISQANAHPLNSEEDGGHAGPYVVGALNGDVDNFADLKSAGGLAHRRRDHHRREGDPDARVAPAA